MPDPFPMLLAASDITLDSLALQAAESAYIESGGQTIGLPVVEAIKAYFVTAAVRARDEKKPKRGGPIPLHTIPVRFGTAEGYAELEAALTAAYEQVAKGKGRVRHANNKPFLRQPIMEIARMVGLPYHTGQIQKKVQEATSMAARGDKDAAKAELLGAINYAAAAWLFLTEQQAAEEDEGDSL